MRIDKFRPKATWPLTVSKFIEDDCCGFFNAHAFCNDFVNGLALKREQVNNYIDDAQNHGCSITSP